MATPADDRDELAQALYTALRTRSPIEPPTDRHDLTLSNAYDVQKRLVERRRADGAEPVGHKIGLTSEGIQSQLGVDEPDYGTLLDAMFVEDGVVSRAALIEPRIEPEIGFLIAEPLTPPVTATDVLAATDGVIPVLEVVDSRVRDWEIRIEDTIADNASSGVYLTGEAVTSIADVDLSLEGVKLYRNGELLETGLGADVLGHPAEAVSWLANKLGEYDRSLEPGHLVLSGSMTPAVDLRADDVVSAEFTRVGTVRARVVGG